MTSIIPISVLILAKNNENRIKRCLEHLGQFDEVLVLDTGSTDKTMDILRDYPNVRLLQQDGIKNFGETRNELAAKAKHDWVLHIDTDEFITAEFTESLASMPLDTNTVYAVLLRTYYRNKPFPGFDTPVRRLYHREKAVWGTGHPLHTIVETGSGMNVQTIPCLIEHHCYESVSHLFQKVQDYSSWVADQYSGEKNVPAWKILFHFFFNFIQHYFLHRCFLRGFDGFVLAFSRSLGSFLKYSKRREKFENLHSPPTAVNYRQRESFR